MTKKKLTDAQKKRLKEEFIELTTVIRQRLGVTYIKQHADACADYVSYSHFRSIRNNSLLKFYPKPEMVDSLKQLYGARLKEKGFLLKRGAVSPEAQEVERLKIRIATLEEEVEKLKMGEDLEKLRGLIETLHRKLAQKEKTGNDV